VQKERDYQLRDWRRRSQAKANNGARVKSLSTFADDSDYFYDCAWFRVGVGSVSNFYAGILPEHCTRSYSGIASVRSRGLLATNSDVRRPSYDR
jgi:hypothetical protein